MSTKLLTFIIGLSFVSNLDIKKTISKNEGLPANEVRTIYRSGDGAMWLGIRDGGLVQYHNKGTELAQSYHSLQNKAVIDIMNDSNGRLWVGSLGRAYIYDGDAYDSVLLEDIGISGRLVFSVIEDSRNNIWLATTGGAAKFNGKEWVTFTMENGLKNNVVHDVAEDHSGNYWFATRKGGVSMFNGSEWEHFYAERNCRKILVDDEGGVWVGTSSGLLKYSNSQWEEFEPDKTTLPMFQGAKDYIWCVSQERDIVRVPMDSSKESIKYDNPTKTESLFHLEEGINQDIWAGTDNGVVILD